MAIHIAVSVGRVLTWRMPQTRESITVRQNGPAKALVTYIPDEEKVPPGTDLVQHIDEKIDMIADVLQDYILEPVFSVRTGGRIAVEVVGRR